MQYRKESHQYTILIAIPKSSKKQSKIDESSKHVTFYRKCHKFGVVAISLSSSLSLISESTPRVHSIKFRKGAVCHVQHMYIVKRESQKERERYKEREGRR